MAGSTTKISVDVTQFKQGMQQAQQSAKTLQAQMKANEAQFKATGDKEQYLSQKSKLLKAELEAQKKAADNAKKALAAMDKEGVEKTSQEYQQMERALAGASAAMYETEAAMNSLTASETQAAGGAGNLEKSLSSIGKNVSLGNIVSGLDKITDGLKDAAGKAVDLGKTIFDEIKRSAKWADDAATMAEIYEIPLDKYLRMQKLVDNGMDTTVENMLGAMDKMSTSMGKESEAAKEALRSVHLMRTETDAMGNSWEILKENDPERLFWAFGEALKDMPEGFDKNAAATAVFGKSWRELNSLFKKYGSLEEYNEALNGLTVNSEDAVTKMAELNDRLSGLESAWNTTKLEVLQAIAPALSDAATALADLLNRVTEYLQTDEGQKKLEKMEEAVSKLFGDLSNIDPEDVVNKFAGVLEKITEAFTWVADHWEDVKTGLEAIGIAFGTIKIASFATNMKKVVDGFRTLWNGAHKPMPTLPGTDSGAPTTTTTGGDGKTGFVRTTSTNTSSGTKIHVGGNGRQNITTIGGDSMNWVNIVATAGAALMFDPLNKKVQEMGGWGQVYGDAFQMFVEEVKELPEMVKSIGTGKYSLKRVWDNWTKSDEEKAAESAERRARIEAQKAERKKQLGDYNYFLEKEQERINNWLNGYVWRQMALGGYEDNPTNREIIHGWALGEHLANGSILYDENGNLRLNDENRKQLAEYLGFTDVPVMPTIEDPEAANKAIADAIGTVVLPVQLAASGTNPDWFYSGSGGAGGLSGSRGVWVAQEHANGIWSVPWDGYPAILHKGERVTPAREISSRSYNSNLYVESMYMNNGTDAAGLAAAMAAAQRRTMSGYGS